MTPVDQVRLDVLVDEAGHTADALSEARGAPVGFDRESVAWVEGFIERARKRYAPDQQPEGLIMTLGCYLGAAIIEATKGAWFDDDVGGIGVGFPSGDIVFPFAKVRKQFEQGVEGGESILSFYTVSVNYIAAGKLQTDGAA